MRSALTNVRLWIGIIVSVVALVVAFSRVDGAEVREAFRQANYLWLLPAIAFSIGTLVSRTYRWIALLYPTRIPYIPLFGILAVGYTVTTVLPFRLGDVVRVFLVSGLHGISKVRTLSTIVVERVLDVMSVILILLVLVPFVPMPARVRTVMWLGAVVIAILIIAILVLWFTRERTLGALANGVKWLPKRGLARVAMHAESAIEGLSALGSPRSVASVLGWTAVTWLSGAAMMWMMLIAFNLPHSPSIALFLVAMSALSMVVPSSPGFVGVYHALMIEALVTIFDAPRGTSASFAVLTHLLLFVPTVIFGVAYMLKEPEIWNQLLQFRRARERGEQVTDD